MYLNKLESSLYTQLKKIITVLLATLLPVWVYAQKPVPVKPRIIISTDIGGTDPDDFQSMIHFLMYSDLFDTEGLISSPSFGNGSKKNILDMIDLYEKDLPKLKQHSKGYPLPDALRSICKQGQQGAAPYAGYGKPTEGSDWIIKCAKKKSNQPLWVLVWGGLEDVAQALHDAPSIASKIKVYCIGGPNKKWGVNSYSYIAGNFPELWFIENNATYYGLFLDIDASPETGNYYDNAISGKGNMGADFKKYYAGKVKMGDTPSLLYMMDGDPVNPLKESWGGSFERLIFTARRVFHQRTTLADTVPVYSVVELHFKGPAIDIPADSACFTMSVKAKIGEQKWAGYYLGKGEYAIKYSPKQMETVNYEITSPLAGFTPFSGAFVVNNSWPGKSHADNYKLGNNWYSDTTKPQQFYGQKQGARTQLKWRNSILNDWAQRWAWLQ